MQFYIKKWSEKTVALMTASGQVLAYFPSILDAISACKDWYKFNSLEPNEILISDEIGYNRNESEPLELLHGYGF